VDGIARSNDLRNINAIRRPALRWPAGECGDRPGTLHGAAHPALQSASTFGSAFFQFNKTVTSHSDPYTENGPFEVIHIRTGDIYMSRGDQHPKGAIDVSAATKKLQRIIEDSILIESKSPIIIMSDSAELKQHLAQRYGFKVLPHAAEHAAYGGTLETCIDLQILKRSSHNYGVNIRHIW
jgi:hypothetical protein